MCSDAPDTTKQQEAAMMTAKLSKEQLDWAKQIYADTAPQRAAAEKRANAVSDLQMAQTKQQMGLADEYADYNKKTFRPLEEGIVRDAQNFDTEAERERLAGLAKGEVSLAGAAARDMGERALTRSGVNPNDGNYAAMETGVNNQITLAQAGAASKARSDAMTVGRALKMDAAGLGRGLPGSQATAAGLALNAGNSAVGSAGAALTPGSQAQLMLGNAYGGARAGYGQAANIYGDIARQETAADGNNSANLAAAGKVAGTALMFMSDKNEKDGRKPVKTKIALAAARKMPVESWRYKKDSAAADGGKTHIGPMAQDVQAAAGDAVAPGGKAIDSISMHGVTLASIQELDKRQQRTARDVAKLKKAAKA